MEKIFTLIFLLLFLSLAAQQKERIVTGRLTSSDGSPMPGVNILIKGTNIGTTSDNDGFYSINAPIGSTLVIAFIGMKTREVLVTADDVKNTARARKQIATKHKRKQKPPALFYVNSDSLNTGVVVMDDKTSRYTSRYNVDPSRIAGFKRIGFISTKVSGIRQQIPYYNVRQNTISNYNKFGIQFTSTVGVERITQIPAFQSNYAQGSNANEVLEWHGPETKEIFSWGPLMRTLEYTGTHYAYDNNGSITNAGAGNGKAVNQYDATRYFKTGFISEQDLLVSIPSVVNSALVAEVATKTRDGVIPGSKLTRNNVSLSLRNFKVGEHFSGDLSTNYNYSHGALTNRGNNLTNIIANVWRTPASFDNSNGLSSTLAARTSEASRLHDNSVRSHAPGFVDNPFGLSHELPDNENQKRFLATSSIRYNNYRSDVFVTMNNTFDIQNSDVTFGVPPGISGYMNGRITRRWDDQLFLNSIISPTYQKNIGAVEIKSTLSYQFNYDKRSLNRQDAFGFFQSDWPDANSAESVASLQYERARANHELLYNVSIAADWLNVRIATRNYFSNTVSKKTYTNFFPTIATKVRLQNLLQVYGISSFDISGSYSRTIRETSLIYANWSYLSTRIMPEQYNQFFESSELFFKNGLTPETEDKFETSANFVSNNGIRIDLNYYHNTIEDFIAPRWNESRFELASLARIRNNGVNVYARYDAYRSVRWGVGMRFAKYDNRVTDLYSTDPYIPLAGFKSTSRVLATGRPLGAIFGTSYQRTAEGKLLIGDDGFPMIDVSPKMIGNPIPDWSGSLDAYVDWKQLRLSWMFDFRRGGDVWNGTQAALDYLGRSAATGNGRTIGNFVFDGVLVNGQPNTKGVSFYDASRPLAENRWVRYGFGGVSEQYIEDGSWIRLSEVMLSYTTHLGTQAKNEIKLSVIGTNLFLITPYTGVDPSSALFGYSGSTGLDLFNVPSTRSFILRITFKV